MKTGERESKYYIAMDGISVRRPCTKRSHGTIAAEFTTPFSLSRSYPVSLFREFEWLYTMVGESSVLGRLAFRGNDDPQAR